tara:strand:+ start:191 stop:805 length:615 start_codon:yes stop_codon:yes gene_type:complete
MTLRLNGSSSGFTEIDAPAAAGSNTLTLPTSSGSAFQSLRNGSTAGSLVFADTAILQVVHAETQTEVEITGTTYTDTNLTANITPLKSDSDILVIVWQQYNLNMGSAAAGGFGIRILRDSTTIYNPVGSTTGPYDVFFQATGSSSTFFYDHKALIYLDDSRSSGTSQLTYKTQARNYDSNSTIDLQYDANDNDGTSTITLLELG